jgi:endonuclease/exonuclease/phosphatase family metal-dependent hydrolase
MFGGLRRCLVCATWLFALGLYVSAHASETKETKLTPKLFVAKELTVLSYNTHLFDIGAAITTVCPIKQLLSGITTVGCIAAGRAPIDYFDTTRAHLISDAILRAMLKADIVALQEVWTEDVQRIMAQSLAGTYPHQYVPRTELSFRKKKLLGSGLMLLSKYPIVPGSEYFVPFKELINADAWAMKGVAGLEIELPDSTRVGIFTAHTGGLFENVCQIHEEVMRYTKAYPNNAVLMLGDLNISESVMIEFDRCARKQGHRGHSLLLDSYRQVSPDVLLQPGQTTGDSHAPRIDYILYRTGTSLASVSQTKINDAGFYFKPPLDPRPVPLSDHYPIFATFHFIQ